MLFSESKTGKRPSDDDPRPLATRTPTRPAITMLRRTRSLVRHRRPKHHTAVRTLSSKKYDYDLFVIGAGSGGVRGSRIAASHGARVGVADDLEVGLGGTCVNVGCVPKKLFAYGSVARAEAREASGFGWDLEQKDGAPPDWRRLIANKNAEIERLNGIYSRLLENAGVDVHQGRASFVDAHTLQIDGRNGGPSSTVTAEKILVAVGGWPVLPRVEGSEHMITSNEAFYLPERPQSAVVVGSGYIAVEFAGIFHGYGSDVTLCARKESILRAFDTDIAAHLQEQMVQQGIDVRTNIQIESVKPSVPGYFDVRFTDGSTVASDCVMAAIGREPKLAGLGLDNVNIDLDDNGFIRVDDYQKTNIDNIFAVGDCTDTLQLTPMAIAEAHCFADTQFGGMSRTADRSNVATAVFSHPNIGTVGLTEAEAASRYPRVQIFKSEFRPMKHTLSGSSERSLMKVVVDMDTDRVVGMHMVGAHAGETMQGFAAALKCGMTKSQLDGVVGIHPTSAEEFVTMRTAAYQVE